jgi:hypothetical protein
VSVRGRTEAQWLQRELEQLFKYRNALIRAEKIVVKRREMLTRMIDRAHKQLKQLRKHPKANKRAIAQLADKVIPALVGQRSSLNTTRGNLLSSLSEVQGIGSPMGVLRKVPAVGVLGGRIFDTQTALRDLAAPVTVTDSDSGGSESADLLAGLLRDANLRTAVSQAQYKVFQNAPQFATGGIVPGVTGQAVPAVVHAGEGVFTRDQMAAIGGATDVQVFVYDERIAVKVNGVDQRTRQMARGASRGLAGRGGGLQR